MIPKNDIVCVDLVATLNTHKKERLGHLDQFGNSSSLYPLRNVDISLAIETSVVRMNKLSILPFRFVPSNRKPLVRFNPGDIIPQGGNGFIVFV